METIDKEGVFIQFSPYRLKYKLFVLDEIQPGLHKEVIIDLFESEFDAQKSSGGMGCNCECFTINTLGEPTERIKKKGLRK